MFNDFVMEKQDLTYLSWSKIRHSSRTAGSFLKATSELAGKKVYYKLSNFDQTRGIIGHECVNELIVDRLLRVLGIEHLHYQLIHADIMVNETPYTVFLNASEDFKQRGESKLALDAYYEIEHLDGETPLDFCIRNGWAAFLYQMFVVDFLILNRDRHGANIEVLRNGRKKTIRLAPLFDHGLSLLFHCTSREAVHQYDVMEDKPTNTFLGSRSTWENLNLIPKGSEPNLHRLREEDRGVILEGLDGIMPAYLLEKIWEMIWKRWCAYESFCHSR